jgi:hypothetical protein
MSDPSVKEVSSIVKASFKMQGTQEVIKRYSGYRHIEITVSALEKAVSENPSLAFDLSKTLVESSCKSILKDRGYTVDDNLDVPRLLRETLEKCQLVPNSHLTNDEIRKSLKKTVGGLQTVVQGLCELRNNEGLASHGRDSYKPPLEEIQAQLAARAADVVVNFLFEIHKNYPSQLSAQKITYQDQGEFNDYIDDSNPIVTIFGYQYKPSRVIYELDEEVYMTLLEDYSEIDKERKDQTSI